MRIAILLGLLSFSLGIMPNADSRVFPAPSTNQEMPHLSGLGPLKPLKLINNCRYGNADFNTIMNPNT